MGLTQTHALGRNLKFFAERESTAGTFVKATATGAAKVLSTNFGYTQERRPRLDNRQSRSLLERITGKAAVSWDLEAYIIPSGSAAEPDLGALYEAACNADVSGSTYNLGDSQVVKTVSLTRHMNDVLMESLRGAWVETMEITATGGDEPKVKFTGGAMELIHTGTSTLNGAMSATATMIVQTADSYNFSDGSVVQVGDDSNSSAGYEITVDTARPSFTLETTVADEADTLAVVPFTPAETVAGSPINGITGSVTHDTDALSITGFTVTLTNNFKPLADEAMVRYVSDIIPSYRTVTGSYTVRARKDWIIHHANREEFAEIASTVLLGTGTDTRLLIDFAQIELDFSDISVPTADEAVLTIPFTALSSSDTAADEVYFDFY